MPDPSDDAQNEVAQRIRELLRQANTPGESPSTAIETKQPFDELSRRDRAQDILLKRSYAKSLLLLLGLQLLATNIVFVLYAWHGTDWKVPDGVMLGWLGATVIEVIGVVTVVVHHLFPRRDQ